MIKLEEKQLEEMAKKYRKSLVHCMTQGKEKAKQNLLFDSQLGYTDYYSMDQHFMSDEEKHIVHMNFILATMEKQLREILWKEYFFPVESFWWMSRYTRSTFYRLRQRAILQFAHLIA